MPKLTFFSRRFFQWFSIKAAIAIFILSPLSCAIAFTDDEDDRDSCQYIDYSDIEAAMHNWKGLPISRNMLCKIYFEDNDDDVTNDIMVNDSDEELVSVFSEQNPRIKHISEFDANYKKLAQYHMVRKAIYLRLKNMLGYLPKDIGIAFISGFKPINEAKREFDEEMRRQLQIRRNDLDDIYENSSKHVMPFLYDRGVATGAYVELTLFVQKPNSTAQLLDLGPLNASLGERSYASYRNDYIFARNLSAEQKKNRFTLLKAALSAGFIAQAGNFRYFSYGDKTWAYVKHKDYALYGIVAGQDESIARMRKDNYLRNFARQQRRSLDLDRDDYYDDYRDDYRYSVKR